MGNEESKVGQPKVDAAHIRAYVDELRVKKEHEIRKRRKLAESSQDTPALNTGENTEHGAMAEDGLFVEPREAITLAIAGYNHVSTSHHPRHLSGTNLSNPRLPKLTASHSSTLNPSSSLETSRTKNSLAGASTIGQNGPNRSSKSVHQDSANLEETTSPPSILEPPDWYAQMTVSNTRNGKHSSADTLLSSLRTSMRNAKASVITKQLYLLESIFEDVLLKLHAIIFLPVSDSLVKRHRMLHNNDGLPQLFDDNYSGNVLWPWYIKADAKELYNKWARMVFEIDIMRGIKFDASRSRGNKRDSNSLHPNYRDKVSAKYVGQGDLVNGQWWPLQICALRDGAHGVSQGGIHGEEGKGAFSVIVSGGKQYADEDHGDWVLYCGTDSVTGSVTSDTTRLLENVENKQPVRLIRSHNNPSNLAPSRGFRYDGLYAVVSFEKLDSDASMRQRHRFRLVRCPGQDPIRCAGPEARPTKQELNQYANHEILAGKKK